MFCNQCEQTAQDQGCATWGVCGKNPDVAALQDLLTYAVRGLSHFAAAGRELGIVDPETDHFTYRALFSTLRIALGRGRWAVPFAIEAFLTFVVRRQFLKGNPAYLALKRSAA